MAVRHSSLALMDHKQVVGRRQQASRSVPSSDCTAAAAPTLVAAAVALRGDGQAIKAAAFSLHWIWRLQPLSLTADGRGQGGVRQDVMVGAIHSKLAAAPPTPRVQLRSMLGCGSGLQGP